jgi:hypothetical protein
VFVLQLSNIYIATSLKHKVISTQVKEIDLSRISMHTQLPKGVVQKLILALQRENILSPKQTRIRY